MRGCPPHARTVAAALALAAALPLREGAAQTRRLAWEIGAGVGAMPDVFSSRCGEGARSSGGGVLVGVTGRRRLPPFAVLEAELTAGASTFAKGCDARLLVRSTPIADGRVEERSFLGYADDPRDPGFFAGSVRAGIETPATAGRRVPLLRASAGAGLVRNAAKPALEPYLVVVGGVGTRGPGARLTLAGEWTRFRYDARQRVEVVRPATATSPRVVERAGEEGVRLTQGWTVVRLGVELPVGRRR
jgi:hypothetical protein